MNVTAVSHLMWSCTTNPYDRLIASAPLCNLHRLACCPVHGLVEYNVVSAHLNKTHPHRHTQHRKKILTPGVKIQMTVKGNRWGRHPAASDSHSTVRRG